MDYDVRLKDGTRVTIQNVTRPETDGSGTRFYGTDNDDNEILLASFYDGQVVASFPANSPIVEPEDPEEAP